MRHTKTLRAWVREQMATAELAGFKVTLNSLGHAARSSDPNALREWLVAGAPRDPEGATPALKQRTRFSRPSIEEWQRLVDFLRAGLRSVGADEQALRVRMSTILLAHGMDAKELAEELKALAPYAARPELARVANQLIEMDEQELLEIEDAIAFTRFKTHRRRRSRKAAAPKP